MLRLTSSDSGHHVEAAHRGASGSGHQQSAEDADRGGFARAVRTQKSEDFAARDVERHVVDGGEIAEALDQILQRARRRRWLQAWTFQAACAVSCSTDQRDENVFERRLNALCNRTGVTAMQLFDRRLMPARTNKCRSAPMGCTASTPG